MCTLERSQIPSFVCLQPSFDSFDSFAFVLRKHLWVGRVWQLRALLTHGSRKLEATKNDCAKLSEERRLGFRGHLRRALAMFGGS